MVGDTNNDGPTDPTAIGEGTAICAPHNHGDNIPVPGGALLETIERRGVTNSADTNGDGIPDAVLPGR